jgi:hypothetical protein
MLVLKIIGIVVVLAIAVVLLLAAGQPETFKLERKVAIHAKPDKILPLLEDFHAWKVWSPWEDLDPTMKKTFSGPEKGLGAVYEWDGSGKVGAGRMEITAVQDSAVTLKLDFLKPFEAHNTTVFTLTPTGENTEVTWVMSGPNRFLGKVIHVFFDMDKVVGKDFEKGLARLKAASEN